MVCTAVLLLVTLAPSPPEEVVARVDGTAITAAEVAARAAGLRSAGQSAAPQDVLKTLIDDALLAEDAERRGLAATPEVADQLRRTLRRLARERLIEKRTDGAALATDEALLEMFHATRDEARVFLFVAGTREEAQTVKERLAGGADFAEEARRSLDPRSSAKGGDMGALTRVAMKPEIAEQAFRVPLRTPVGPFQMDPGFAVIEVRSRYVADEKDFPAAKEELRKFAVPQLAAEAKAHYAQQLRKRWPATVDDAFLDRTGTATVLPPGDMAHVVARTGDAEIRYGEIVPDLAALSGGSRSTHMSGPSVKKELVQRRIDDLLFEREAVAAGFDKDPVVLARFATERRQLLAVAGALDARARAGEPTEAEIEQEYRAHPADHLRAARRECWHLLAASRDDAEALRKKLAAGTPLDSLSRQGRDGRIGEISFDRLDDYAKQEPALAAALRTVPADQPSAPVQSRMGWHVLRCGPVAPEAPIPLAEARPAIAQRLRDERARRAFDAQVAALRGKARISIDEQGLSRALAAAR